MLSNNSSDGGQSPLPDILMRISEVLDFSLTDSSDPKFEYMSYICDILKLLLNIEDVQDRMKVMAFIRTISDRYPDQK